MEALEPPDGGKGREWRYSAEDVPLSYWTSNGCCVPYGAAFPTLRSLRVEFLKAIKQFTHQLKQKGTIENMALGGVVGIPLRHDDASLEGVCKRPGRVQEVRAPQGPRHQIAHHSGPRAPFVRLGHSAPRPQNHADQAFRAGK